MFIVPVRHHSPAAALHVERLIRERRPRAVLVEGPADATSLIPLLLDAQTAPPVALYAYRRHSAGHPEGRSNGRVEGHGSAAGGGQAPAQQPRQSGDGDDKGAGSAVERVRAVYYPFCDYSPEYVALKVGHEIGARLAFCDVPAAVVLQEDAGDKEDDQPDRAEEAPNPKSTIRGPAPAGDPQSLLPPTALPGFGDFASAAAAAAGFGTFEEFWEAAFEQDAGARAAPEYVDLLTTFGTQARDFNAPIDDARDTARERYMAAAARALVHEGIPEDDLLLVCGAAHAAAIARAFTSDAPNPKSKIGNPKSGEVTPALPAAAAAEIALIPFSFPRLSEQLGYGAGNRAPWYYQQVWRRQGDYPAAARHGLLALARHLRGQGQSASLAQCIDAYSLAQVLAGMRRKRAPGVDELREAAVACLGQGQPAVVATALHQVLIGDTLGRITPRVGRTPLQAEFYATAQNLGLPVLDAPRQVLLHMVAPREAEQSIFLHRLTVAEIPFGQELESGLGGGGRLTQASPLQQLARVREKWELQWSPATDAQLIERTAWGSTLSEVCSRLLRDKLAAAARIDDGTTVLLKMALCSLVDALPPALARCEALAADSASFPALARATYHLDGLLAYGAARRLPAERLGALAARLFARAALHLPSSAICGDDAAREVQETLASLYDLVQRRSPVAGDPAAFWSSVAAIAELPGAHAGLRGLALVLLELDGRLAGGELTARLRYWLSRGAEAADNARLIAGLFSLHRATLVRNRALVGAVTDFLLGLGIEQLTPLLPVLRRSLGSLSGAERTYLSETLAAVLGIGGVEAGRALRLASTEAALLHEADAAVASMLAQWKERYGIE